MKAKRPKKGDRESGMEREREIGTEREGARERKRDGGRKRDRGRSSGYVKEERRRQATLRASQAAGRQPLSQSTP